MGMNYFQKAISSGALAFVIIIATVPAARASIVYIASEDGNINVIGYTGAQECKDKYYQQCITVHPNCGGSRIYVAPNISKVLHHWNDQGKNFNIGPSKNGQPYCRTKDM